MLHPDLMPESLRPVKLASFIAIAAVAFSAACTPTVRLEAPREPITINLNVKIDQELRNTVTAIKDDLAFQVQTGNMSRAPYDLLKLEYLAQSKRIKAAAFALPTKFAAAKIGSNIANFERVSKELAVFAQVIHVPILLIAFE